MLRKVPMRKETFRESQSKLQMFPLVSGRHVHTKHYNFRVHKANRYFRARNMLPRNNADVTHVTHCGKTRHLFKTDFYLMKIKTQSF